MNAAIRAHNLIDLLEDLTAVLNREIELLERPNAQSLTPVVEEKQALFKLYEDHMKVIAEQPDFATSLPEELKTRLTSVAETFEAAVAKNRRRLELLQKSSQQIVGRIVEAAKEAAGAVPHYSRSGGAYQATNAAPVAMNREI